MTPEQKVVSLETAKKLQAAGFPQDTERWWSCSAAIGGLYEIYYNHQLFDWSEARKIAAPDATEIGELLPPIIKVDGKKHPYSLSLSNYGDGWRVAYNSRSENSGMFDAPTCEFDSVNQNEAEARAACWLWLKEQKLL